MQKKLFITTGKTTANYFAKPRSRTNFFPLSRPRTNFTAQPKPSTNLSPFSTQQKQFITNCKTTADLYANPKSRQRSFSGQSGGEILSESSSRELKLLPGEGRGKSLVPSQRWQFFCPPQFEDKTQSPFKVEETVSYRVPDQGKTCHHIRWRASFIRASKPRTQFLPSPRREHIFLLRQGRWQNFLIRQIRGDSL